jgi:hypothetical protein
MKINITKNQVNTFWAKVEITTPDECWIYKGAVNGAGYGTHTIGSRTDKSRQALGAHRLSYFLDRGEIPVGLVIHHECRNTLCVNPHHLEAVSNSKNVKLGVPFRKPRTPKTHCPKGHEYSKENTRLYKGNKNCRECNRVSCLDYYYKTKSKESTSQTSHRDQ